MPYSQQLQQLKYVVPDACLGPAAVLVHAAKNKRHRTTRGSSNCVQHLQKCWRVLSLLWWATPAAAPPFVEISVCVYTVRLTPSQLRAAYVAHYTFVYADLAEQLAAGKVAQRSAER